MCRQSGDLRHPKVSLTFSSLLSNTETGDFSTGVFCLLSKEFRLAFFLYYVSLLCHCRK